MSLSGGHIMSRRCIISKKGVLSGNNRSHAENKTRRKFLPNVHDHRIQSSILNTFITMRVTPKGLRTIEKKGGLDEYLLGTPNSKLTDEALKIKRRILKKSA